MRAFKTLAILPFTLLSCVQAQNSSDVLEAAVKALPECALNCMLNNIRKSSCELTDFYCLTRNKEFIDTMTKCIKSSCTIRESLRAKNFTESVFGGPVRDHTKLVSYTGIIGGSCAILAIILRMFARLPCLGGTWGWDDWAILTAMLPVLPLTGLSVVLAHDGLGKDMWAVPFDNITHILYIYYFDESFYLSSIALTKISILLFYLRIFPNRIFRRWVYLTIGLCSVYILSFIPATIFQCLPIHIAWERWDGEHHGKCINLNAEGWTSAVFNIILDLIVICLPLRELSKLAMSWLRKAGIMLMFFGGGFVTVISMFRLKWMIQFANTENVTWDYTPIGYWSTLEVHIGILIACLPALRSLQTRLFPSTKNSPSYYHSFSYTSKRRPPFPSIAKFRRDQSNLTANASHASMLKSRDKTKDDKNFIQLDEYEVRVGDMEKGTERLGRGVHNTDIERGSMNNDDVTPLTSSGRTVPSSSSPNGNPPRPADMPRDGLGGIAQGIMVKQEYSVKVEAAKPEDLNPSPRASEEGRKVLPKRSRSLLMKRREC
ncbi:hypothetical protein K469DRAFT_631075 [Zopfia rhizophila CBS 207.26]|uniref:CFEM domain-containing protein n=1 Tax=Zopfia rhizophila CBS 207.26 TaxID=1314779 RepID=A0A6A6E2X0_9PEZI|nr:hypothetical protein K469DRAFT_631075 [Zopfia rhizophila CBS 207.26]